MPAKKREPITISIDTIARQFELVGYYWFDGSYKPPVFEKDGGYQIRIMASRSTTGQTIRDRYDYFELDSDGIILRSPRGHATEFNKLRVTGLPEALVKYTEPDPQAARLAL